MGGRLVQSCLVSVGLFFVFLGGRGGEGGKGGGRGS